MTHRLRLRARSMRCGHLVANSRRRAITMRSGITLFEMICVLAILIIVAAVGIPMVQAMLDDAHVTAAGDMIRARLADARSKAMDQGRSWRLSFQPGSGVFQLAPDDSSDWGDTSASNPNATPTSPTGPDDMAIKDELPKGIVFGLNQGDVQGGGGGAAGGNGGWQTIVVYQWDGSALDDSTIYFGKHGTVPMRINVRGLTGAVSIEVPIDVPQGGQQK